jgi:acyl-CoA synthetase (NDP forming)
VEEYVCNRLGLKPASISTQIVQRDHHAEYFTTLAIIASSIDKFAVELRHLQRTEVLEAEVLRIARKYGIRLVGPNCVGLADTHLPLDTSFLPPPFPPSGNVALISQSGAVIDVIIDWARTEGLGFSHLMSLGNKADIVEADVLEVAVNSESIFN